MGIEAEHFVPEFLIKSGHYGNNDDQNRDSERHAENGDERDNRNEGAFWLQIAKRKKQAERSFHRAVIEVAASSWTKLILGAQ